MEDNHSTAPESGKASPTKPPVRLSAGEAFVRKIRPAGCVLFLVLAVLVAAVCLTSGRDPIPGYAAPQTAEYYAENPDALAAELAENVFPALPDYDMSVRVEDGGVVVTIADADFVAGRAAILRYFDEELITFERG